MVKEIFIADKELLQLANYTLLNYEEFETKYTIDNNVYDIKKEVGDDYSFLSIETNDKSLAFLAYYDEKKDSDNERMTVFPLSVDISFFDKKRNVGFEVSRFLKKYNSINYYRYPFRKILFSEYEDSAISFCFDGKKIKTNSLFNKYNNNGLRFYKNEISDDIYNYDYYVDGNEIKLIYDSRIDVYRKYYYDELKEKIDNFDIEKETERILRTVTSYYPYRTYDKDRLYDALKDYLVKYKEHFEGLLYVRLEEVREAIKNRKIMLEERKRAPYFSKEELTEIMNYLTNYKKSDTDSLQKKKHM